MKTLIIAVAAAVSLALSSVAISQESEADALAGLFDNWAGDIIHLREDRLGKSFAFAPESPSKDSLYYAAKEQDNPVVVAMLVEKFPEELYTPVRFPELASNQPSQPIPYNGSVHWYVSAQEEAPLEIRTSGNSYYYIKLKDAQYERNIVGIFIKGGETIKIKVPLGKYIIVYASGKTWYGYKHIFGPNGSYNKTDSTFSFTKRFINNGYQQGYQTSGHTITLYEVFDGNLSTSRISLNDF